MNQRPTPRFLISAAEPSADEHAAGLVRAFLRDFGPADFIGFAGPQMRAAGVASLGDLTARASMLLSVVGRVPAALRALLRVDALLARGGFDAAVLVDSGTFHLPLARRCHARGVPVLYFIAPQTWASRRWRNRAIRTRVTRLACILPFEADYFARYGVAATYVGHPLFDRLQRETIDRARAARLRGDGRPVVAILPGSRRQEIARILPRQLAVAGAIARRFRAARFLVSAANGRIESQIRAQVAAMPDAARFVVEPPPLCDLLAAADLALVTSGTATLEAAYHHVPMIVMYDAAAARLLYPLLRGWMIHAPFLSLPNILAGRRIVPEYMPYIRRDEDVAVTAIELLGAESLRERMRGELAALMRPIVRGGAAAAAARELVTMMAAHPVVRRHGPTGSRHAVW
ncbi:MAG: lipid-A-disaccharide synthase [Phycisphaerae bacterium]